MERSYGGSELGFKSLTFSPFIITRHSLGMGLATDGEGRQEERFWPAINLSKLEMSRPTQPRQGAGGALISLLSCPPDTSILIFSPPPSSPPLQMFGPAPPPARRPLGLSLRTADEWPHLRPCGIPGLSLKLKWFLLNVYFLDLDTILALEAFF